MGLTGADSKGQARVKGTLEAVVDPSATGSQLTLSMQVEVLGKLATLGAMPMRRRADEIFTDFVRRINAELTAPAPPREDRADDDHPHGSPGMQCRRPGRLP